MSRTPGRRTDRPDDEPTLQVDELGYVEIGQRLDELGKQLAQVGTHSDNAHIRELSRMHERTGAAELEEDLDTALGEGLTRTLSGLREFRRSYDYWERVIAEFALKRGFTQRQVAHHLGVSTATINRWAQNPIEVPIRN